MDINEFGDKSKVINHLTNTFLNNIVDPNLYQDVVKRAGLQGAYDILINPSIPNLANNRKGRFGEMLSGALLLEFFDYHIPIQKQQYFILSDMNLPSTDLIAVRRNGNEISEICFLESKLRITKDKWVAVEGYNQLKNDYSKKIPDMVSFVMKRLYDNRDSLWSAFLDYLSDRENTTATRETFRIGIVNEIANWDDDALKNLNDQIEEPTQPRTVVDIVLISKLETFVKDFFHSIGLDYNVN